MPDSVTTTSTFLDGVLLVANGISDLAVILDSPPCGDFKFRKVGIRQDLFSTLNPPGRVARPHCTGVRSAQMTLGSEEALLSAARRVDSLLSPGAFMVTATSPVQVTGEYHELATRRLTQELGKPVFSFPSKALSGDALDGIEAALLAAVGALPLAPGKTVAGHVAIVGMPFDRNECDCLANLSELQRLISALGLHCCCVLPSGQTFQQCAQLESAQ